QRVSAMLGKVARSRSVGGVASPYTSRGAAQVSWDGRTAYATVTFTGIGRDVPAGDVKHVIGLTQDARARGLQVELGGQAIQASDGVPASASEKIGIIGAGVVLLIAFGSLFAMALPLVTAVLSLIAATMGIGLPSPLGA